MSKTKHEIPLWRILLSNWVLVAVSYVVVGVVLLVYPDISYISLCYIAATAVMLIGLVDVVRYIIRGISEGKLNNYLSRGLIEVLVSVFMFVRSDYVVMVLPILLGLAIVMDGIVKLQRSIDLMRLHFEGWVFVLILAAMSLAIGAVLVFRPLDSTKALTMVMGIAMIYCGVTSVVVSIFVNLKLRSYRESLDDEEAEKAAVSAQPAVEEKPQMALEKPAPAEESTWVSAAAETQAPVDVPAYTPAQPETIPQPAYNPMAGIVIGGEEEAPADMPLAGEDGEIPFENIDISGEN